MKNNSFIRFIDDAESERRYCNKLKKRTFETGKLRVTDATKHARLGHTGWYADNFQDETFDPVVIQLPSRKGELRYLPGYREPWNDGIIVESECTYSCAITCARAADGMAQMAAESSREDDAKFQAEQEIETLRENINAIRENVKELISGIRESVLAPSVCEQLRADIREAWRKKTRAVKRIAKLENDPWLAVNNY